MEQIPELYNSTFMDDAGLFLNLNGTGSLVYEVSSGLDGIENSLECIISCRKQTQTEIKERKSLAQDMLLLHNKLRGEENAKDYSDIWEIDVSYKVMKQNFDDLSNTVSKTEKYSLKNKVVLFTHGISSAKQTQSFYPGFVEMNGHLYCVTKEKCKEILKGRALDLSFFIDSADGGDMLQTYYCCASGKTFAAFSFLLDTAITVKYKDVFSDISQKQQKEFYGNISRKTDRITKVLSMGVSDFVNWRLIKSKEDLIRIFGESYEFEASFFSFLHENNKKYGQIVSVSDFTSNILSRGFL